MIEDVFNDRPWAGLPQLARNATLFGHLCENFVIMELRKQISWSRARPRMSHFRTHSGQEVDALLKTSSGQIVGMEVKASETVNAEDFRGLRALAGASGPRCRMWTPRNTEIP